MKSGDFMENWKIQRGAEIVVNNWLRIHAGDRVCFVTSNEHYEECRMMQKVAEKLGARVNILFVEQEGIHVGDYFDRNQDIFQPYDIIVGASDYSIITTKAADAAISQGKKLLSLPLSTNNGESMLGFDFMTMDVNEARITAETEVGVIGHPDHVHITTDLGTNLHFSMKGRNYTYFNGNFWPHHNFSSASFEICIPIVENATNGTLVCDGSFGYIGKVAEPVHITFKRGRITDIEQNSEGKRLQKYFESYHDKRMYVGGELGIGLNEKSRCAGACYIEDESTYGTFHIGVGRNIGLGGKHQASGHFDLVTWKPNIWFDGHKIMEHGSFLMPD